MVGIDLALMIADIKRISQLFQRFKTADMLEVYAFGDMKKNGRAVVDSAVDIISKTIASDTQLHLIFPNTMVDPEQPRMIPMCRFL